MLERSMGTTNCGPHLTFDGDCYLRVCVRINLDLYSILLVSPDTAICRLIGDTDLSKSPSCLI